MNKKAMLKKNAKGITLIALIITIIILLILALVTIGSIKNSNIITYAQNASSNYNAEKDKEEGIISEYEDLIEENQLKIKKEKISKTESFVGYYADVDGNGSVDGIIYADLAFDFSKGEDSDDDRYSYIKKETLNNYYIIKESNKCGSFEEKQVIAPIDKVEANDRFYVMALTDFSENAYTWYENAHTGLMDDYEETTSGEFGKGKENTRTMMTKVYGEGLKESDLWKHIGSEVSKGWFVPSRGEWASFLDFAIRKGLTNENYTDYGLKQGYWASSQIYVDSAWNVEIDNAGVMIYCDSANDYNHVRLSTTF